ncbi:heparinase II/III family protein [Sphingomonas cannabina]|uniref:alginate lyase family protein n=1 Tax=Sphingomonas cannabina TaxID=2899123 RepID=UPI001F4546BE|nr:alginate lyase family protein [Sphingomonas cannabina]UIJ44012.1 heparinase II/III family protein [Sphingomonas cannabina]
MRMMRPAIMLALLATAVPATAMSTATGQTNTAAAPVLLDAQGMAAMAGEGARYPLFAAELRRVRTEVDAAMRRPIDVPVPKDPGGGFTHEQHKRNYTLIYGAGLLYRITGERAYADYARTMLLAYARLYPTLGKHPAASNEEYGKLFWQSLNDSVWVVYAVQGYDAIRDTLTPADRKAIDDQVFRPMAKFLSEEQVRVFDLIHNHATWSCAAVGMIGYVLRDHALVDKALKGSDLSGKAGFLRQVDLLFSPDGYYTEGPYYQRYALLPFVLFARVISENDPSLKIFQYRDGVLVKAITTAIQLTQDGYFFPINDAMPDKSLKTDELYQAVAIGYGVTHDPALLSIAEWQGRTVLSPDGLAVARDVAAGKAKPFAFASALFRDGPDGGQGGLAVMRDKDQTLLAKNSAMGMGHGHFDKLNWLLYDNGHPIVVDYGAARFLNVESKDGGRYLKENESWAKQSVAHNTLVVNETSQFAGKWKVGQTLAPRQVFFSGDGPTKVSTGEIAGAWPGVTFRRTLVQLPVAGMASPLVVDLMSVKGGGQATYDLPLHYNGHITDVGFPIRSNVAERPVLGKQAGYQHIWVDATGTLPAGGGALTWMTDDRFYTYRMLPPAGAQVILGESGANDPNFNLRREPLLIERVTGKDVQFVNLLEPHGVYDPSAETTVGSSSRIAALRHARGDDGDLIAIDLAGGGTITLAIADSADPAAMHRATIDGRTVEWKGHFARFDGTAK